MVCSEGRSLYSFCLQPIADGVCSRLGSIDIGWHCVPWNVSHVHLASHYNSINSKLIAVHCTAFYNHLDLEFSIHEAVGPGCSFILKQDHLWTHAFSKSLETKVMKIHDKSPKKLPYLCLDLIYAHIGVLLSRLLGAILVVGGFYMVVYGQALERRLKRDSALTSNSLADPEKIQVTESFCSNLERPLLGSNHLQN